MIIKNRLISLLKFLENRVCGELVLSRNIKLIEPIAQVLPILDFGFECRLDNHSADSGRVDFAVALLKKYGRREIFAGLRNYDSIDCRLFENEDWRRIRDFCKIWADKSSLPNKYINQFWLEFDIPDESGGNSIPIPRYFYSLHSKSNLLKIKNCELIETIENIQTILTGGKPDKNLTDAITLFSENLTGGANLFSFGGLTNFGNNYGRVSASNMSADKIIELAEKLYGFSLSAAQIKILTDVQKITGDLYAAFDIADNPQKIGVFCLHTKTDSVGCSPVLNNIFCYLSEKKLCSAPKKNNSLGWNEKIKCPIDNDLIEENMLFLDRIGKFDLQLFVNKITHQIKLEFYKNGEIKTKGYYGFRLFFTQ
ncbi:MAG TPA: hypothetical protein PKY81_01545 [bacterium]|nr:hypothetical protein [bacterium]HPN29619.1 hypothetical protein [bacterium]